MKDEAEKIAVIENEVQAELLDAILNDQDIPHLMRSYHDAMLDGLFQNTRGWGHVEAPPEYKETILSILDDIENQPSDNEEQSSE